MHRSGLRMMAAVAAMSMSIGGVALASAAHAGKPTWAGKPTSSGTAIQPVGPGTASGHGKYGSVSKPAKPVKATGEPCSVEQANLTNAQARLDWFAQRYAAESTATAKAKVSVTRGHAKARQQKALAAAKAELARTAHDRVAQQGRVADATAALTTCLNGLAASPTPSPSDAPTATPTDPAIVTPTDPATVTPTDPATTAPTDPATASL